MRIEMTGIPRLIESLQLSQSDIDRALESAAHTLFISAKEKAGKHTRPGGSGQLEASITKEVFSGEAFVYADTRIAPHAVPLHEGHRKFRLYPRDKKALAWAVPGGFAFAKWVDIPEWPGDPFFDQVAAEAEGVLTEALNNVLPL